jgi:hypothetical protein
MPAYDSHVVPRRGLLFAALGGAALLLTGCGDSLTMAPASGTVTLDGHPVEIIPPLASGMVTFVPADEGLPYAYGEIGHDGTFRMQTPDHGDGAAVGNYRVMIGASEYESDDPDAAMKRLLPFKYSIDTQSGLTAEVTEGENVFTFILLSEKP